VASSGSEPELAAVGEEEEELSTDEQLASLVQSVSLGEEQAEVDSICGLKAELREELALEDSFSSNSHVSCYLYVNFL